MNIQGLDFYVQREQEDICPDDCPFLDDESGVWGCDGCKIKEAERMSE